MLDPKKAKRLRKELALQAARRWQGRNEVRSQIGKPTTAASVGYENAGTAGSQFHCSRNIRRQLPVILKKKRFGERIIRTQDFTFIAPSKEAMDAGIPVARLQSIPEPRVEAEGFATGFLV